MQIKNQAESLSICVHLWLKFLFNHEQRLAEFHRLAVFLENRLDRAGLVGLDGVEDFHRLDDAQGVADLHLAADLPGPVDDPGGRPRL